MADDVNPELRAELEEAAAILDPEIRGLHDLRSLPLSDPLKQEIDNQIAIRERRRGFIRIVLDWLDKAKEARFILERDGYPNLEGANIAGNLLSELNAEVGSLEAAAGIFKPGVAKDMKINLGNPVAKP